MDIAQRFHQRLVFSSPSRRGKFFELLERRQLLCASAAEMIANGIPAEMISDGHIAYSDYVTLSAELQAHIDPHMVQSPLGADGPIDFDKILGIPTGSGPQDADVLPDFFPLMYQVNTNLDLTSQPGRALLKFGTQVNNQGNGPGSLISGRPGIDPIPAGAPITSWTNPDGSQNVLQPVYNYTGSGYTLSYYRAAGTFTYHTGHSHFHYDGYADYKLRHNVGGSPGGYVMRGDGSGVVGSKTGFCLLTFSGTFTTEWGANSSTITGFDQDTNVPSSCGFGQGIRVGRYDRYDSSLEGQWIDVAGVTPGSYFIEIALDATNGMLESNETNNVKTFAVNIPNYTLGSPIVADNFDSNGNHNDTFATAADMGVLGPFTQTALTIHHNQDEDWFEFDAASTSSGTITSSGNGNIDLYLYNDQNTLLASSTNPSGADTVTWNFVAGQEYYVKTQTYNSTVSNNYQIAWNVKPTVNAATPDAVANEFGPNFGRISIGRNGPVSTPLTVNFSVGGTAIRGTDYKIQMDGVDVTGNSVTIGNEAAAANLDIVPLSDTLVENTETVILTVTTGSAYVIGGTPGGTVNIGDLGPQVSQSTHTWQTSPNKLAFVFTLDVGGSLTVADLTVMNLDTSTPVTPASFVYDQPTRTATVTFAGALPDARYRATLAAAGITHALGAPMPADFVLDFFQLTGDANHDGRVNLFDYNILSGNYNQSPRDFSQGDFNYDGQVNIADYNLLVGKYGTDLNSARTASVATQPGRGVRGGVFATGRGTATPLIKDLEPLL